MTEMTGPSAGAPHPHPELTTAALTDEQRRGAACAFCGTPVCTEGAVDLGRRPDADGVLVFPRAHRGCLPDGAS